MRWPWSAPEKTEPELPPDFERRLKVLEDANRERDVEWSGWYDKFRLLYARLAKRVRDAAEADHDTPPSAQDASGTTIRPAVGYGHPPLPRRNLRGF